MNRRWGRSKAAFVMVVVGVLGISACSNDPAPIVTEMPTVTPTETPSPSPTPSPSATELTEEEVIEAIPPLARSEGFTGAQEFAKFALGESQRVIVSGDVALFEAISAPGCVFCENTLQYVADVRASGQTVEGGSLTWVQQDATGGLQEDGQWRVEYSASVDEERTLSASGEVQSTVPAVDVDIIAILKWTGAHWQLVDLSAAKS